MNRLGHDHAKIFVGTEVEHSPAHGHRTLFVVGIQDVLLIATAAKVHKCDHIYFGANQSFPQLAVNDSVAWKQWDDMITYFLERDFLCTLDADVSCVEGICEGTLTEYPNFIPMLSVKIPYLKLLGYNATLKLDDRDFRATNPGVWCHSLHSLQRRSAFTSWLEYTKDEVIS